MRGARRSCRLLRAALPRSPRRRHSLPACGRHGHLGQEERKPVSLPCRPVPPALPTRRVPARCRRAPAGRAGAAVGHGGGTAGPSRPGPGEERREARGEPCGGGFSFSLWDGWQCALGQCGESFALALAEREGWPGLGSAAVTARPGGSGTCCGAAVCDVLPPPRADCGNARRAFPAAPQSPFFCLPRRAAAARASVLTSGDTG